MEQPRPTIENQRIPGSMHGACSDHLTSSVMGRNVLMLDFGAIGVFVRLFLAISLFGAEGICEIHTLANFGRPDAAVRVGVG